jgi:hypothetical protein
MNLTYKSQSLMKFTHVTFESNLICSLETLHFLSIGEYSVV